MLIDQGRGAQPGSKTTDDSVVPMNSASSPPSRSNFAPFFAYVVAFHAAWAVWPYFVYPKLLLLGERTLAYAVANLSVRCVVWVLPVLLYLQYVDRVEPFDYLKLRDRVRRGIAVAVVLTTINFLGSVARFGLPHPSLERISWNSVLGTSLLIGLIEEIPYRGFMLQKFAERVDFWVANLITSLLFVSVHLPGWFALHTFVPANAVTIFVFGFVMGLAFRYSGSLWAPILTHSANDFMSFVLFGR